MTQNIPGTGNHESKRLFFGIKILPDRRLLEVFSALKTDLGDRHIKWTDEANFHLTLWFFGQIHLSAMPFLEQVQAEAARQTKAFYISLRGTGSFGRKSAVSVLWIGVDDPGENLLKLYNCLQPLLLKGGYSPEARGFHPHLTLGRVKASADPLKIRNALEKHRQAFFQAVTADHIILYESITRPQGPVYIPLRTLYFDTDTVATP